MKINLEYFTRKYLENRPLFMTLIRPQEAMLFFENKNEVRKPILDFGCGDGFFAETIFGKKIINVGLDLINSRAEEAERNKIYKKVIYYDGKTIPYPDCYFNTVISNCVLEHIPNLDVALNEIHRVLKPGGIFMATVMTNQWEKYLFGSKILGKIYIDWLRKKQEHFNLLSNRKWKLKFEKSGFMIKKIEGYVSPKNAFYLDLFHYLSIPSLISYLFGAKWIVEPIKKFNRLFINKINHINQIDKKSMEFSALFFIIKK